MRRTRALALILSVICSLSACSSPQTEIEAGSSNQTATAVQIGLSDSGITINGAPAPTDPSATVYTANDIVYYEDGHDFTYGEGSKADAHPAEEANAHTVIHITQPGTYALSGKLSAGQVAVDLGEDARDDPNAVVALILNRVDITCTVAPAIIFYNVYECGDKDAPTKDVDTSTAGANVIIADGTTNYVNGSYVARIYKADTVELTEDGTEVADAKKLHKYDAAFYSKMSMNVDCGDKGDGILHIAAENEGLDSELHLTINGGSINISSGNDGINTNEDGVSVTTINSGTLTINVTGETGEGDGIDSNGWLVINGGTVIAAACSDSADAGIDSDMGIHINGGTVIATGHMLDRIEDGGQTYAVFSFQEKQPGGVEYTLTDGGSSDAAVRTPANDFTILLISNESLAASNYTLWRGDTQLAHSGVSFGRGGMDDMGPSNLPDGELPEPPEGFDTPADRELPDRFTPPHVFEIPEGMEPPENLELPPSFEMPETGRGPGSMGRHPGSMSGIQTGNSSTTFTIADGANLFSGIIASK